MTGIISAKQKLAGRACSPRPIRLPAAETFRSCQPCLAYAPSPWAECVKSCSIALLGRGPQDTQGRAKQGRAGQRLGPGEAGRVDGQQWVQLPVDGAETMGARLRQRTERPSMVMDD